MLNAQARTLMGFRNLIESEFIHGGHRFGERCGTFGF